MDRLWQLFARAGFKGYMSAEYESGPGANTDTATAVPKSVVVKAGQSTATFVVGHHKVSRTIVATISANLAGTTKTTTLTVTP